MSQDKVIPLPPELERLVREFRTVSASILERADLKANGVTISSSDELARFIDGASRPISIMGLKVTIDPRLTPGKALLTHGRDVLAVVTLEP